MKIQWRDSMAHVNRWCDRVAEWRLSKGFHTPATLADELDRDLMLGKLMLVVSEVAEAAEAVRDGELVNFMEELADVCIRVFDICGTMGIDLEGALEAKMSVNEERPQRHGRKTTL